MITYHRDSWQRKQRASESVKRALAWALIFDASLFIVLQPFRPLLVVGDSMFPTLTNKQFVLARRLDNEPRRGQIVVADYDDESIIKRVAGVAGDVGLPGMQTRSRVPDHHVYLLGDNSKVSCDSRQFGPMPESRLKYLVVFPFDAASLQVNTSNIGS